MGAYIHTIRTGFYQELLKNNSTMHFELKRQKYIPAIDTLYFSAFIEGDCKKLPTDSPILPFLGKLELQREEVIDKNNEIEFSHGLLSTLKSYKHYRLCLTEPDLYDIFICNVLPNDNTPRILIQLRALGIWTRGIDNLAIEAYRKLAEVLDSYECRIEMCRESRIDYCYHTNAISTPNKIFEETNGCIKNLHTSLEQATITSDVEHVEDGTILHKGYVCFGRSKSNNVRVRIYDKVKEVIENGYKGFFFKIWHDNGLISYYDKWCMEYALPYKNTDYLHKARLLFYVKHGRDPDRRQRYSAALENKNTTLAEYKHLADEKIIIGDSKVLFLPKITTVINIEYETKRKFYYYSDFFIDNFNYMSSNIPKPLERIFKVLDNKRIFLEYLTRETLSFHNGKDEKGNYKYLSWWERLRNTKLDGLKTDQKLLREYSLQMDKKCVQKRIINAVASSAVYEDKVDSGFIEDVSDLLADISDNAAQKMGRMLFVDSEGEVADELHGSLLRDYYTVKAKKEKQIKNRKRQKETAV